MLKFPLALYRLRLYFVKGQCITPDLRLKRRNTRTTVNRDSSMDSDIEIRRPGQNILLPFKELHNQGVRLVTPGDIVTDDPDYMRGHGEFEKSI